MPDLVDDLLKVDAYPEKTSKVELVQTHISSVFICDEYVYKVKKSVNFGFLDFSTLEKRKFYCEKEVELNRRFSEGIYLGMVPITFDGETHKIGALGEIVEYAVRMKRVPDECLLKNRLKNNQITDDDLVNIAKTLSKIHKNAKTNDEISEYGALDAVKKNTDENFEQIERYIGVTIDEKRYTKLKDWTDGFYKEYKVLFDKRIQIGKIKDCHGDIHMEHICLRDPIAIIDCIEFNERFRYCDVLSDLAFLLMDLEFNARIKEAKKIYEKYLEESNEMNIDHLVNFYKVYRACVRGKVTNFLLDNPNLEDYTKTEIIAKAEKYFDLANSYII